MTVKKILKSFYLTTHLFLSLFASSQSVQSYVENKVDSLNKIGVDTLIWFHQFHHLDIIEETNCCFIYEKSYLAWKSHDKLSVLVYSYFYNSESKSSSEGSTIFNVIDTSNVFLYLKNNFESITTTLLRPAVLRTVKDSQILIRDYGRNPGSHPGYIQIMIFTPLGTFRNGFTPSDLHDGTILNADGSFREKWESLHYESNKKHPLYILTTKLCRQIAFFDDNLLLIK